MTENFLNTFQYWLDEYLHKNQNQKKTVQTLLESQSYSLQSGGKRFRPYLASEVFQIWNKNFSEIKNYCLAIEMVHTYSLIHDDLPCMDNDDYRRGKPTNHKVFSESTALLAGDALLTEAFYLISSDPNFPAEHRLKAIEFLSLMIGHLGMVGGQVLDMQANSSTTKEQLELIHEMKTACLIQASATGAAILAGASQTEIQNISLFSKYLGMAFQIKDDLLDSNDNSQDYKSFVFILGRAKTIKLLEDYSSKALTALIALNIQSESIQNLNQLILNNQNRDI